MNSIRARGFPVNNRPPRIPSKASLLLSVSEHRPMD